MIKKSILLLGALSLLSGMAGLVIAGTHSDCIKNCIDTRTTAGEKCLSVQNDSLKQCEASRAKCLKGADSDAAKRDCKAADLRCKSNAGDAYLSCIKVADAAVKKCKDECPADKKPSATTTNTSGAPVNPGAIRGFNPQPEPPARTLNPSVMKGINPQPEPPKPANPGTLKGLNPQPEPPGVDAKTK